MKRFKVSQHFMNDRAERFAAIKEIGFGREVARKQISEIEVHIATSTGLIIVINPTKESATHEFCVTIKIARLAQYERITNATKETKNLILAHQIAHLNEI